MTRSTILRADDAAAGWNFVGGAAWVELVFDRATKRAVATDRAGAVLFQSDDPFAALAWMEAYDRSAMPGARWVGFISYEFARCIERLPTTTRDDLQLPLFHFTLCEPADAAWRASLRDASSVPRVPTQRQGLPPSRMIDRSMSCEGYLAAATRALNFIAAGDVFQVNLAHRFTFDASPSPHAVWERMQSLAPAAFGALIEGDDYALVSNSPELFFRIDTRPDGSRRIINRPIKGTRPNAPGMFDELSHSAKDRAELAMIVDLQRNDLGRVCEIGSVVVTEPRRIETTKTVLHGVATIEGTLRNDASFADAIRALFPCGSITGCPKVRAMEIIDELEPVARGPYCGAIGYLGDDGIIEFNVAIRTIVMAKGIAHVYVGGGIVAESSPEAEYAETLVKARAMLDTLGAKIDKSPRPQPDWRDRIEREPPGWGILPLAIVAVVMIFFILIPWVLVRFTR